MQLCDQSRTTVRASVPANPSLSPGTYPPTVIDVHHIGKEVSSADGQTLARSSAAMQEIGTDRCGSIIMFITLIAAAAIILAGVLWIRPWHEDHYHPYD
jgi:hypothetical protein